MGDRTAKDIFLDLLELGDAERGIALSRLRDEAPELATEVESLLRAHRSSGGFLAEPTSNWAGVDAAGVSRLAAGTMLADRYRIGDLLGEGAFGEVYRAEQVRPIQRAVAVKLLKPGMDSRQILSRFELERQALARMDHPGVARVLDAGATPAGRLFFVMELVEGEPITEYCRRRGTSVRERLALMIRVCGAVLHAHQKGLIHRDLKPSNILVFDSDEGGRAKIIDFGIAKAARTVDSDATRATAASQLMGTPAYMSPEQAAVGAAEDIDTRSDIYALGAVLYELLTGDTPIGGERLRGRSYAEIQRTIRESSITRPSLRAQSNGLDRAASLRGEIDWIVMKCLEKDRTRRYESAGALAADLDAYLNRGVVRAAPPSWAYLTRKFVSRHRGPVAGASALVLVLMLGIFGTAWGLVESRRSEAAAVRQGTRASVARLFLERTFRGVSPQVALGRDTALLGAMMDDAAGRIESGELCADPEAEHEMRLVIAGVYEDLARYPEAARVLRPVLEHADGSELTRLRALTLAGRLAMHADDFDGAHRHLGEAQASLDLLADADPFTASAVYAARGTLATRQSRLDDAVDLHERSVAHSLRVSPADAELVAVRRVDYAAALHHRGRLQDARAIYEIVLDEIDPSSDSTVYLTALSRYAELLVSLGQAEAAIEPMRRGVEMARRIFPDPHPTLVAAIQNLAGTLFAVGAPEEALGLLRECLSLTRQLYGDRSRDAADVLAAIGATQAASGWFDDGAATITEAISIYEELMPGGSREAVGEYVNLAETLRRSGRVAEAVEAARRSVEVCAAIFPPDAPDAFRSLGVLGSCLRDAGRLEEAIDAYRRTIRMRDPSRDADYPWLTDHLAMLGTMLLSLGTPEAIAESEGYLRDCLRAREGVLPEHDLRLATTRVSLGRAVFENARRATPDGVPIGSLREAEGLLIKGLDAMIAQINRMPPAHRNGRLRPALETVIDLYEAWEETEPGTDKRLEAERWRERVREIDAAGR